MLPAEGFGIELRALVLFEADSAVWARLGKHPDNNKDTAREPGSRSNSFEPTCVKMHSYARWLGWCIPPRNIVKVLWVIFSLHTKQLYLVNVRLYLICAQLILFGRSSAERTVDVLG